jgi:hypothetical protein
LSEFSKWFERSVGSWVSHRRYLYGPKHTVDNLSVNFSLEKVDENIFTLSWSSERNEGTMDFILRGNECHRSRSYYHEDGNVTMMSWVDEDTVVFETSYDGTDFREEIRLIDGCRLRQTVGRKKGSIVLVGQYFEVPE